MRGTVLLITILLALLAIIVTVSQEGEALTYHDPIAILDDDDFTAANGVVSGTGTVLDPYIISGWEINITNRHAIRIEGTAKDFVIEDLRIKGPKTGFTVYGIWLYDIDAGTIRNVVFDDPDTDVVHIYNCHPRSISISNLTTTGEGTIQIRESTNVSVLDCDLSDFTLYKANNCNIVDCVALDGNFQLASCSDTELEGCDASDGRTGLIVLSCTRVSVENSTFVNNSVFDARIHGYDNRLRNNTFGLRGVDVYSYGFHDIDTSNTVNGKSLVYLTNTTGANITGNVGQVILNGCRQIIAHNLTMEGLYKSLVLYNVSDSSFEDMTLSATRYVVDVDLGNNLTFDNVSATNLVPEDPGFPFRFHEARNVTIVRCYAHGAKYNSILFVASENASSFKLLNTTMVDAASYGFRALSGENTDLIISGCTFLNNTGGVSVDSFRSLTVLDNTIVNDNGYGIYYVSSYHIEGPATISGNHISGAARGIESIDHKTAVIDSNTIVDCGIGINLDWKDTRASNNTIDGCPTGIRIVTWGCVVENNTISNCSTGIQAWYRWNVIRANTISNASIRGIIAADNDHEIYDCEILDSAVGIYLYRAERTTVVDVTIRNCTTGIEIVDTENATIRLSRITDCSAYAVDIVSGSHTMVFHNTFNRTNYNSTSGNYNGPQAIVRKGVHDFDNGEEGNYWDDYGDRYPSATATGRIWDTPYSLEVVYTNDRYPLVVSVDLVWPVARAGADIVVDQNTTVTLDGTASTDDVGVWSYEWTFQYDGEIVLLKGAKPSHTFDIPGTYQITLKVRDRWGNEAIDRLTVLVLDTQPPVASAGPDITLDPGEYFTLDSAGSWDNGRIVYFNWTIDPEGLNTTFTGPSVRTSVSSIGVFTVRLRVEDAAGNWAEDELILTVRDIIPPSADAGDDITVDQGEEVELDGLGSTDNHGLSTWVWSFEYDGEQVDLAGPTVTITFALAGTFDVTLTVTDMQGLTDSDSLVVEVVDTEPPVADAGPDIEVDQGSEVVLDGTSSTDNVGIASYHWIVEVLGGEMNKTGDVTRFTIFDVGTYGVTLRVNDTRGNWAKDFMEITVLDALPPTAFAGEDVTVEEGTRLVLNGSASTDNVGIVSHTWTFMDGSSSITLQGGLVTYVFQTPGTYEVQLMARDARGLTDTDRLVVTVIEGEPPSANAGKDQRVIVGSTVTFDGSGSFDNIGIVAYGWTFRYQGSDREVLGETGTFTFGVVGTYQVTLTVVDASGIGVQDTMNVTVLPEEATWRLGPFQTGKGKPLEGVHVKVLLNGKTYEGDTDAEGWLVLILPWSDLVSPAHVTAKKDGYKPLETEMGLDGNGMPRDELPSMKKEDESPGPGAIVALCCLATVAVAMSLRRRQ